MRFMKWIFFGYLALVVLLIGGLAFAFAKAPARDPDTFYTTYVANLKSLDPAEVNDVETSNIVGNIFETLYNYRYGVQPYTVYPQVASAMPNISDDHLTWTIPLRKGIRFYDPWKKVYRDGKGPEIKAKDFIFAWKRVANFGLGNTAQYSQMFEGNIEGLDEWWNYTKDCTLKHKKIDWDTPVAGWTALDDYTIQIKLTKPFPQLMYYLAYLGTAAVSRDAAETLGDDFKKYPIGSGPFAMHEHLPEQRIILEANPLYRGLPDVDGYAAVAPADKLPHMKHIQVDYFPEPVPAWLLFKQGLFDNSAIPRDAFNKAISISTGNLTQEMQNDGIVLNKLEIPEIFYTGFNMQDPIVGRNKPLRQAMSMAYDRDTYIKIYVNGRGTVASGPIPPGFSTYDPKRVNPFTQFNLDAARAKVKEAEVINGGPIPELTLLIGGTETQMRQNAEFFVSQMAQIGVKVKFQLNTWARFQEMVDDKQAQLFGLGWSADYPDEQTFLQLFYSKNAGRGGVNSVNYSNPDYDKLYEQAIVMDPSPTRDDLYRKMQDIVIEDCPWICEFYPISYSLRYNWVKNAKAMEYGNGQRMSWMYLSVDSKARADWLKTHK